MNGIRKLAPFLILISGCLWGSMGLFVRKLTAAGLTSLDIVGMRAFVTVILMGIILLLFDRKMFRIRIRDIWCFIGTGICSIILFNYCYFSAIMMTSLSVAAVLLYTAPAFVMLMSFFLFGEKMNKNKWIALLMTFVGCVLVTGLTGTGQMGALSVKGIVVGLGAGFGYALYSIFSRYAIGRGYHSLGITFYTFLFATIGSLPLISFKTLGTYLSIESTNIWFILLFGLVSTVLPYLVYTAGLEYVENGQASIIASIEPVVATMFGIFVFKEKMTMSNVFGMILVLGAIVLCNLNSKKK